MLESFGLAFVVLVTPNVVVRIVYFARKENIFESMDPVMILLREIVQILEQINNYINFSYAYCVE